MSTKLSPDSTRIFRHLVATIAFRASRSLHGAPPDFENARLSDTGMTARELLLHMTNVMSFAQAMVTGTERVRHQALPWADEVARFYSILNNVDQRLAAGAEITEGVDLTLIQGPLADVLTHIGQLHAMRRKAGAPVAPTNYVQAAVQAGRTALEDQPE